MASMLKLELFGTGQASYDGQILAGFPGNQSYLVLCFLLLNHHYPQHRDHLATVFWGEYPTHISRKYLRNALWKLRQAFETFGAPLDNYLSIGDDCISVINTRNYWVDVDEFETRVTSCQNCSGQNLTLEQAADLEKAVELYRGDLLEGVYADWCLYDRERLSILFSNALAKMMSYYETHQAYESSLAYGERILSRDSTREKVHLQMMHLYELLGDRQAALLQYKRCAQILREELGIQPMRETTLLYQHILHDRALPSKNSVKQVDTVVEAESSQIIAEYALREIDRLRVVVDATRSELSRLESVLSKVLIVIG
jgi:DNA-binding SARP family transcriptional activator